jgi:hypothetical protein
MLDERVAATTSRTGSTRARARLIVLPGFPWPPDRDAIIDHVFAQAIEGLLARP